jgi:hypothetical protein
MVSFYNRLARLRFDDPLTRSTSMKTLVIATAILSLTASGVGAAADVVAGRTEDSHRALEPMPRSLEVRFALSALPPSLRDGATVYVLDPSKGYVRERTGTNGQSCFVSRTEWKFADYRSDIYDPTCYDATGAKHHMRVLFEVAALRARGVAADEVKRRIEKGFRTGRYTAPKRGGFSYMTAPLMRTYMSLDPNDKSTVMTMSMPHVMYYAPNIARGQVGGLECPPCAPYPFLFEPGPHGYFIQRLGDREAEKIVSDESELVRDLCSYSSVLCLQKPAESH